MMSIFFFCDARNIHLVMNINMLRAQVIKVGIYALTFIRQQPTGQYHVDKPVNTIEYRMPIYVDSDAKMRECKMVISSVASFTQYIHCTPYTVLLHNFAHVLQRVIQKYK